MKSIAIALTLLVVACASDTQSDPVGGGASGTNYNDAALPPVDHATFVDPFIGTGGHGHTFPGATRPFGMVQLSPDTRLSGWDGCSGYHYSDDHIYGFSHTHLSGTGVSDYGDILLMPGTGEPNFNNGADGEPGYRSKFSKDSEEASPGYYKVHLDNGDIDVELTATERVGIHRYRFPSGSEPYIIFDLAHRDEVIETSIKRFRRSGLTGHRRSKGWAEDQVVHFFAKFSRPVVDFDLRLEDHQACVKFAKGTLNVVVHVGISAVDMTEAHTNLTVEAGEFDFPLHRKMARAAWNKQLGKVAVDGGTDAQRRTFYTALYHACIAPNLFSDISKRYRGMDGKVHRATDFEYYTVFSLWDTFRAAHPLLSILEPRRTNDFVRTMLAQYQQGGALPVWELAGNETDCMIGYHAVPVIWDAYAKGIRGFDAELALEAMKHSADRDERGLPAYREQGFIPAEVEGESVSKTLEYAYDDWCIAQMAKALGRDEDYARFSERAQSYKNVFDPSTGFMRAKRNHRWVGPFRPEEVNSHFTEANAWQYSMFAPHDIDGLIELLGGRDALAAWLDRLFEASSDTSGREQADITGLIGQYAHGNEPSHHMAYLYCFAGQPWKTQERVRQILDTLYTDQPDGLCGNEDCGQMSAWYVLSALGFYPVTPGANEYIIGTPIFPSAQLRLKNGKRLTIRAPNVSKTNRYVQGVLINGVPRTGPVVTHEEIMAGGSIVFTMGPEPSRWAAAENDIPSTSIGAAAIVPVPFIAKGKRAFRGSMVVELGSVDAEAAIRWSVDDGATWADYAQPIPLDKSAELLAYAVRGEQESKRIRAQFKRIDNDWKITLANAYANQYAATGPGALIDGLRGHEEWRAGEWQGFQEVDLDATVDLGEVCEITAVRCGFLQEQKSWIWLPEVMKVEISVDGKTYELYGAQRSNLDRKADGSHLATLEARRTAKARYVRVTATNIKRCPDWHIGAGGKAWIFADEIEIDRKK